MRKVMVKKLYTLYKVKGAYDDICNNPEHIIKSYSGGYAECIRYHDSISEWIKEIEAANFKNGFGLKATTENGYGIVLHRNDLQCSCYECNCCPREQIIKIMANILTYYFGEDSYYYEIDDDYIYMTHDLTGHIYYNSPYESCDKCGTCDGARCDSCKQKYTVKDLKSEKVYYSGYDKKEAERILKENKTDYSEIIADILTHYNINMEWFETEIGDRVDIAALNRLLATYKIPCVKDVLF